MDQKDQMKDYYKILGVKRIASPEEIHARWIELMRKFHPDRGKYKAIEDEPAREINEAYAVLKDSSSRSEYDLRRAYQRKKKSFYLQRVITPPAVFIILLILALVYLQRPGSVRPPKSSFPSIRGSIQNKTDPLWPPVVNELNVPNQTNPRNPMNLANQQAEIDRTSQINQIDETDETNQRDQTNQRKSPGRPNPTRAPRSQQPPRYSTKARQTNQKNQTHETNETSQIDQTGETDHRNQRDQINQKHQPRPMSVSKERKASPLFAKAKTLITVNDATPSPNEPSHTKKLTKTSQPNQTDPTDGINPLVAQLKQPSSVITEEEIRHFLEHYKERYVHQDIDGFLSLFSSKAVQNGRDGFEEIKTIYSDFFHQSNKIQYHLEDMRIEIYQEVLISGVFYEHAAQVEARYQVDQTLIRKGEKKVWKGDIRWTLVRENGALKILYLRFKPKKSA